ncbi:MAG: hypothetical protein PVF80_10910 [Gammaproteobacteria bacterium]|jgi:hypothetical protein
MRLYWYQEEVLETLELDGLGSLIQLGDHFTQLFFYGAYGIICLGLLNLQKWARTGLLLWLLSNVIIQPFLGLSILTGIEALFSQVFILGNGALLAIVYLSSISEDLNSPAKLSLYTDHSSKNDKLNSLTKMLWVAGGIFVIPIELTIALIIRPNEYFHLSDNSLFSNVIFFTFIVHLIISFILSRPARNIHHTQNKDREIRDPFAGLDRYELADHGYGIDYDKSKRYRTEAFFFGFPGILLFLASILLYW